MTQSYTLHNVSEYRQSFDESLHDIMLELLNVLNKLFTPHVVVPTVNILYVMCF